MKLLMFFHHLNGRYFFGTGLIDVMLETYSLGNGKPKNNDLEKTVHIAINST
jgi:hypothetical protein